MTTTEETPVVPANGKAGVERDSTARRTLRELEALRREIERWRALTGGDQGLLEALLHHSPHGIIVSDSSGRFIVQNRASERIWAGSATIDSVEGWGLYRAFHPDGRPYEPDDWSMARCLTLRQIVEAEEVHFQRFDGTHGILLGSCAPILGPTGELDGALGVFADITALKHVEERLQLITDSLPVSISYVDRSLCYRFVNLNYQRWFGLPREEMEGQGVRDVIGEAAFAHVAPHLERALAGEAITFQSPMPYRLGGERYIEATYIPHFGPDRSVLGVVGLVSDISERRRMERERARWAERTEHLLRITASLADAVTPAEVLGAVVDRTAQALHASSAGLWLVDDDRRRVTMARAFGDLEGDDRVARASGPLVPDDAGPVQRALRDGEPVWVPPGPGPRDARALATLPLTVEGRRIGALAFTFEGPSAPSEEDRALLLVVARHCAQALERVRLLREAEAAYGETTLLYRLTDAVNRAQSVEEVYETSLDTIRGALGIERAAILVLDGAGVLRFKAWRGLSDGYRAAIEGHAAWGPAEGEPQPVYIEDAPSDAAMAGYAGVLSRERIAALAFVPLVYESRLLGELMLCWNAPRVLSGREKSVARSIADQVASAVGRKRAQGEKERLIEELSQTVRLNELFTGVVGHDLRNPLSAIMNTAQLALRRDEGERLHKPLRRVLSAGERMTRMIEQLLDFTRARAGGSIPVEPHETDLGEVGPRVVGEVEDANPDRAIAVEAQGDLHGIWDADRLAQVLSNLAGNAIQHGAPDAPVMVHFDGRRPAEVQIRVSNHGTIRPELLPMLFEPLRAPKLRKSRSKGLGLGLYITQQIVHAHGGTIEVRSVPEEGTTTITVTLPRERPPASRPSPSAAGAHL